MLSFKTGVFVLLGIAWDTYVILPMSHIVFENRNAHFDSTPCQNVWHLCGGLYEYGMLGSLTL